MSSVSERKRGAVVEDAKFMVPPQLTQPSRAPKSFTVRSIQAVTADGSVMSTWVKSSFRDGWMARSLSRAVSKRLGSMSQIERAEGWERASEVAVTRPMPEAAAVRAKVLLAMEEDMVCRQL